ncbi:hypothetical protein LTR02_016551 [Friedmanniomyces endolithicus]|nr:hypothetical protein LTR59_002120 [Friedmanniomyces endolithicus]KAK0824522.1 hypothetical protein LTR03_017702 [Friedmanniomyces endolithicus]KAK0888183.1 hypothetical protein LTR02_016551 [Friedmanniomyces endolithicus]KAK0935085.1 hypothetical protein LTR29_013323 [Friedmanniomyces endolithicus]KAK0965462.1 hypothetical protein LTS01_018301 [Friedmanniomyces endolithicus]
MGCCTSTPSSHPPPHNPHPQLDGAAHPHHDPNSAPDSPNSSQNPIAAPRSLHGASNNTTVARRPHDNHPPNSPLVLPPPLPHSPANFPQHPPPWTRSLLTRLRAEFFDTQLSGDPLAWIAIRRVCELLREGDVGTAQAVLDAAALTTPRGLVGRGKGSDGRRGGVWDAGGVFYEVPGWVVGDPGDLVEDLEKEGEEGEKVGLDGAEEDTDEDLKQEVRMPPALQPAPPRVEKGKGRAESPGRLVKVACRRSDRGRDLVVEYNEKEPAALLAVRVRDKIGEKRVRLVFRGRLVDGGRTLAAQGWREGLVVNAFVDTGD